MPWVRRFSPGKSVKDTLLFWYGISQKRGMLPGNGVIFSLCVLVFAGEIGQKRHAFSRQNYTKAWGRAGKSGGFFPAWAGFRWGIAQKCYAFSMRNYTKLRSAVGEWGDFCPWWAGFRWEIAQNNCAFSMWNYIKLWSAAGGGGGLLPLVGRYSLGNSTKTPCFFGAGLHKITECWRGRG